MPRINVAAVLVSVVVAFIVGGLWYSPLLFGKYYMTLRGLGPSSAANAAIPVGEMLGELARWLVITIVLARFMALLSVQDVPGALAFGAWMWLAIYAALAGSVLHENYPWRVYAIHAGDGLVKIMLIAMILALWRPR